MSYFYRENFDLAMNTIKLYVHYSQHYVFANGALQRITVSSLSIYVCRLEDHFVCDNIISYKTASCLAKQKRRGLQP